MILNGGLIRCPDKNNAEQWGSMDAGTQLPINQEARHIRHSSIDSRHGCYRFLATSSLLTSSSYRSVQEVEHHQHHHHYHHYCDRLHRWTHLTRGQTWEAVELSSSLQGLALSPPKMPPEGAPSAPRDSHFAADYCHPEEVRSASETGHCPHCRHCRSTRGCAGRSPPVAEVEVSFAADPGSARASPYRAATGAGDPTSRARHFPASGRHVIRQPPDIHWLDMRHSVYVIRHASFTS